MTEDERFETIMAACRAVQQEGRRIVGGSWGISRRQAVGGDPYPLELSAHRCCPLGALIAGQTACGVPSFIPIAARRLGVDQEWVLGFTEAFDWDEVKLTAGPDAAAGARVARRVRAALGIDR